MPHKRCLELRLVIVAVLCMLVPTFGVGLVGYSELYDTIRNDGIRSVGHIANDKRNELITVLQRVNSRSSEFLHDVISRCNAPSTLSNSCLMTALTVFYKAERSFGASLHVFVSGEDIVVGAPSSKIGDWIPFKPGQLARFSDRVAGQERTYDIAIEDDAHSMRLVVTFPVSLIQPLFVNDTDLGRSGETFLSDAQGLFHAYPVDTYTH